MQGVAPHTAHAMAAHWDQRAGRFDAAASHIRHAEMWRGVFREALGDGGGAAAIDLGSGTGACALLLAELGYRVTAVDGSAGMLAHARSAVAGRGLDITFIQSDMDTAGLAAGSADAVTIRNVLWTLEHPSHALRLAQRLLRPGGRVLVSDGLWRAGPDGSEARFGHKLPCFNGVRESDARDWLDEAGFGKVQSWQHLFEIHPYGPMYDAESGGTPIEFFVLSGTK